MKYTVVVVNYNKEKYIKRCIDSIINQTYKNFELIIIDDGSTDNSRIIINEYKKYNNVKIYFKKNTGVSDTRNFALSKIKTKYFTFVDSDDYIDNDLLKMISNYNNYDILSFNCYSVHGRKSKIVYENNKGNFISKDSKEVLKTYIDNKCLFLVPWGYIYNIDLFKRNHLKYIKGYVHEDVFLTTKLLLNSKKTITIDYYGYYYVQSKESIIRTKDDSKIDLKIKSMIYNLKNLKSYFEENIEDYNFKRFLIDYYASVVFYAGFEFTIKKIKTFCIKLNEININDDLVVRYPTDKFKIIIIKKNLLICYKYYRGICKVFWKFHKVYCVIFWTIYNILAKIYRKIRYGDKK